MLFWTLTGLRARRRWAKIAFLVAVAGLLWIHIKLRNMRTANDHPHPLPEPKPLVPADSPAKEDGPMLVTQMLADLPMAYEPEAHPLRRDKHLTLLVDLPHKHRPRRRTEAGDAVRLF